MENEETYFAVLRALVANNQMSWVRGEGKKNVGAARRRGKRAHILHPLLCA